MSSFDCDVVIVGGGPAGATAALTLARAGCQVVLIEGSRYEQPRVGETLPPSARPLLDRLGLWEAFDMLDSIPSFGNQSAWGGPDLWSNSFIFSPYGSGWHLDRQRFDSLLADIAVGAGAKFIESLQVTACVWTPGGSWKLVLKADDHAAQELTARAAIDATGRRATLARWQGARRRVYDHLVSVAMQYRGPRNDGGYTLVEATADGWWYSSPIPSDRLVVMFMTDADLCRLRWYTDPEIWKQSLAQTQHTRMRTTGCERIWGPKVFSAVSHRLERKGGTGRWLACGDAAMGVDPLSSSGILRALRTGEAAGRAMADWLQGKSEVVPAYEQWLDAEFANYWQDRGAYYALETRWPDMPFWQRRSMGS